jgi:hypothetical protein
MWVQPEKPALKCEDSPIRKVRRFRGEEYRAMTHSGQLVFIKTNVVNLQISTLLKVFT